MEHLFAVFEYAYLHLLHTPNIIFFVSKPQIWTGHQEERLASRQMCMICGEGRLIGGTHLASGTCVHVWYVEYMELATEIGKNKTHIGS